MVPITLLLIFLTIYASTRSVARTCIVLSAVPLSLIGTFWLLYALDYNLSIAVWVGVIALAGLSAETGVVMLLYLDRACDAARAEGRLGTLPELREAVFDGAARRVRPGRDADRHDRVGTAADHVEHRHRGRRDEAHRGADGGRRGDHGRRRAADLSGRLLHLAGLGAVPIRAHRVAGGRAALAVEADLDPPPPVPYAIPNDRADSGVLYSFSTCRNNRVPFLPS